MELSFREKNQLKKKRLKAYELLENNQTITYILPKEKKAPTEFFKQNVRVLSTLSRTKYEFLQSQKKNLGLTETDY